jgi:phosphoglycolate phosphatase/pyrophosphatase PpaX
MLKYPCLVVDHDDTVVQSEATVNYPCFCEYLAMTRPGVTISFPDYINACSRQPFIDICRQRFGFSDEELQQEYHFWMAYVRQHAPIPFPGIREILHRQKAEGGLVCVASMSGTENILRDYNANFGIIPDAIYSWDLPEQLRKPSPYPLQHIMETYHLSPTDLIVIDDMKPGVDMARAAGVKVGFAAWGRLDYPEIMAPMEQICDFTFRNTQELEKFLFWEE